MFADLTCARGDQTKRAMRGRTTRPRPWRPGDGARDELFNGTRPASNRQSLHARQPKRSHLPLSMRGEQVIRMALLSPEAQVGGSARSRELLDRHAQQILARARLPEPPTRSQLTTPAHAASAGPLASTLRTWAPAASRAWRRPRTRSTASTVTGCSLPARRARAPRPDAAPRALLLSSGACGRTCGSCSQLVWAPAHTSSPLPAAAVVAQAVPVLGPTAAARSSSRDRN